MRRRTWIALELAAIFLLAAVCVWSGWIFGLATAAHQDTPAPAVTTGPPVPAVQPAVVRSLP